MDTNKQSVSSQLAAMNAATAQVVTLTSGPQEDVDHTAVGTSRRRGAASPAGGVRRLGGVRDVRGVVETVVKESAVDGTGGTRSSSVCDVAGSSVGHVAGSSVSHVARVRDLGGGGGAGDVGGVTKLATNGGSGDVSSAAGGAMAPAARSSSVFSSSAPSSPVPSSPALSNSPVTRSGVGVTVTGEFSPAWGDRLILPTPPHEQRRRTGEGRWNRDEGRHKDRFGDGTGTHRDIRDNRRARRGLRGGKGARRPIRICEETEYIEHIWPSTTGRPPASPRRRAAGRPPVLSRRGWSEEPEMRRGSEKGHPVRACSVEGSAGRAGQVCFEEVSEVQTGRVYSAEGVGIRANGATCSEYVPTSKTQRVCSEEAHSVRVNRNCSEESRDSGATPAGFDANHTAKSNRFASHACHPAAPGRPEVELTPRSRSVRACSEGVPSAGPAGHEPPPRQRAGSVDAAGDGGWGQSRELARRVLQEAILMQEERRRRDGGDGSNARSNLSETGELCQGMDGKESWCTGEVGNTTDVREAGDIRNANSAKDTRNADSVTSTRNGWNLLKTGRASDDEMKAKEARLVGIDAGSDAGDSADEGDEPTLHRARSASEDLLWVEAEEAEELAWVESRLVMRFVDVEPTALRWRPGSGGVGEPLGLAGAEKEAETAAVTEEAVSAEEMTGAGAEVMTVSGAGLRSELAAVGAAAVTASRRSPLGPHGALLAVLALCLAALAILCLDRRLRERRTAAADATGLL